MALFWTYVFSCIQSDRWLTAVCHELVRNCSFFLILSKRTCCLHDHKVVSGHSVDPLVTLYRGYTSTFPFLKYREWTAVKTYLCNVIKGWAPCVLVIFIDGFFCKCEEELWEPANLNPWLPLSLSSGISYISVSVLLQELAVLPVHTHSVIAATISSTSTGPGALRPLIWLLCSHNLLWFCDCDLLGGQQR